MQIPVRSPVISLALIEDDTLAQSNPDRLGKPVYPDAAHDHVKAQRARELPGRETR
jgi:hypothetical protein